MISGVSRINLYVGDQDRAKAFWTETMGFDLLTDTPMGDDGRWIEVAPPDKNVILVLFTVPEQRDRVGTFSNVIFTCDKIETTYRELTERGVEFSDPPAEQFWGWWAVFKDPDGNSYGLGGNAG